MLTVEVEFSCPSFGDNIDHGTLVLELPEGSLNEFSDDGELYEHAYAVVSGSVNYVCPAGGPHGNDDQCDKDIRVMKHEPAKECQMTRVVSAEGDVASRYPVGTNIPW